MLGRMLAATAIIALAPAGRRDAGPSTIADASITIQEPAAPEAALNGSMRRGEAARLELAQAPVNPNDVGGPRYSGGSRINPDNTGGPRATSDAPVAVDLGIPQPSSSYRVKDVGYNDVLNIRSGPNANSNVVGTIPPDGKGIRIYGRCSSSWCPIQYNGVQGWANGYYLMKE
jgi:uncharacterized protein YgiM (DUF1202 family)